MGVLKKSMKLKLLPKTIIGRDLSDYLAYAAGTLALDLSSLSFRSNQVKFGFVVSVIEGFTARTAEYAISVGNWASPALVWFGCMSKAL